MSGSGRLPAFVALLVVGGGLLASIVLTTPWSPLGSRPVPGGRVPVDPARDFTAAEQAREHAFHSAANLPSYLSVAIGLLVALVLGLTSWGGRFVTAAARPLGGGWVWQVLLGGLALAAIARLAALPFDAWTQSGLRRYGLSVEPWPAWLLDVAKSFGLSTGLLLVTALGLVTLARRLTTMWWLPAAAGGALLVLVVSFAYPVLVEPVFNNFTPMNPGPLRTSLVQLAARDRVPVKQVLVADASRRTTTLNAYVSGFGSTRRLVVYDNLLQTGSPGQVRLVVAHELGHAKRGDVLHGSLIGALGLAAGACLLFVLLSAPPLLARAGATGAGDPRALGLIFALVAVLMLASAPLQSLVSRRIEARADVHALDLTRDPATFASMQRRLAVTNLSALDPSPFAYLMYATHPTPPQRIALAREWARLHGQQPPRDLAE